VRGEDKRLGDINPCSFSILQFSIVRFSPSTSISSPLSFSLVLISPLLCHLPRSRTKGCQSDMKVFGSSSFKPKWRIKSHKCSTSPSPSLWASLRLSKSRSPLLLINFSLQPTSVMLYAYKS